MLVLKARRQKIEEIVFSPDGLGLAAAGHSVLYWPALHADREPQIFGSGGTWGVGFVADGTHLVTSTGKEGLWTFPVAGGEGKQFDSQASGFAVACSPVERRVVVLEHSGELSGWRIGHGGEWEETWTRNRRARGKPFFAPDGSQVCQLDFQPHFHSALVAPYSIECNHPESGLFVSLIPYHSYTTGRPTFSPDRRFIASYRAEETSVQRLSSPGLKPVVITSATRHRFTSIAFHPSGRFLAATSNDATVKLYDTETWQLSKTFTWNIGRLRSVAFSPDSTLAAAGSDTGKIIVWDIDL